MKKLLALVLITVLLVVGTVVFNQKKSTKFVEGEAIVTQLQALNRYETTSFTIEKIIEAGTNGNKFDQFLFGDRILLIAHGQVIAGFDFSQMKPNDVVIDGNKVVVTLPPPEILITRIDNTKTRVYDRQNGLLSVGDKDLESIARLEAEQSIRTAACEGGILQHASENARSQISALLYALRFDAVEVMVPEGNC